jgi:Putative zinc-finger
MGEESPGPVETMARCQQQPTDRYLLRELDDAERDAFEAHYFECASCAQEVRAALALIDVARAAAVAERPRAEGFWAWLRGLASLRLAAAGAMAGLLLAGYQGLVVVPGLQRELAVRDTPRALTPTVLRSVTRGQAPEVVLAPGQPSFVLAVEAPPAPSLEAALVDGHGRTLFRFPVPRPAPGEPLEVLIPARDLSAGQYSLVLFQGGIERSRGNSLELDRSTFVLKRR